MLRWEVQCRDIGRTMPGLQSFATLCLGGHDIAGEAVGHQQLPEAFQDFQLLLEAEPAPGSSETCPFPP